MDSDIPLSTGVALSARFPFVTPSGWFVGPSYDVYGNKTMLPIRLNDGGYYDNSGTDLLLNLSMALKTYAANENMNLAIYVVVIGDASSTFDKYVEAMNSVGGAGNAHLPPQVYERLIAELEVPTRRPLASNAVFDLLHSALGPELRTLFGSREYRSKESVKRLLRANNIDLAAPASRQSFQMFAGEAFNGSSFLFPLSDNTPDMPVGWLLSYPTRARVALRIGGADCDVETPVPPVRYLAGHGELTAFMKEHDEGLFGALDNWTANCSMKALLEQKK